MRNIKQNIFEIFFYLYSCFIIKQLIEIDAKMLSIQGKEITSKIDARHCSMFKSK